MGKIYRFRYGHIYFLQPTSDDVGGARAPVPAGAGPQLAPGSEASSMSALSPRLSQLRALRAALSCPFTSLWNGRTRSPSAPHRRFVTVFSRPPAGRGPEVPRLAKVRALRASLCVLSARRCLGESGRGASALSNLLPFSLVSPRGGGRKSPACEGEIPPSFAVSPCTSKVSGGERAWRSAPSNSLPFSLVSPRGGPEAPRLAKLRALRASLLVLRASL